MDRAGRARAFARSFEPPALLAMLLYVAACFTLYPEFPFARVDMFSQVGPRHEGASPVVLVDGVRTEIDSLTDFRGLAPSDIVVPEGIASSEGYVLDDIRNHLRAHQAAAAAPEGDVRVSFGWRRHHVDADGTLHEDGDVILRTGTARRLP